MARYPRKLLKQQHDFYESERARSEKLKMYEDIHAYLNSEGQSLIQMSLCDSFEEAKAHMARFAQVGMDDAGALMKARLRLYSDRGIFRKYLETLEPIGELLKAPSEIWSNWGVMKKALLATQEEFAEKRRSLEREMRVNLGYPVSRQEGNHNEND